MPLHTDRQYEEELQQLRAKILEMGGIVEKQIGDAMVSLVERNSDQARAVIERVKHRAELEQRVGDAIAAHDRESLLKVLDKADVPATPVNTVDQVLNDAQTATRPTIRRVGHPKLGEIPVVGMPVSFSGMDPGVRRHAPMRGEHTDQILAESGYNGAEIADLRARKVVS